MAKVMTTFCDITSYRYFRPAFSVLMAFMNVKQGGDENTLLKRRPIHPLFRKHWKAKQMLVWAAFKFEYVLNLSEITLRTSMN